MGKDERSPLLSNGNHGEKNDYLAVNDDKDNDQKEKEKGDKKRAKSKQANQPQTPGRAKFMLGLYSVLMLITSIGNSIFFKKMTLTMPNYPYFLSQFTVIAFVPIFFAIAFYQRYVAGVITDKMWNYPKLKFFIMGAFDSLSGVLGLFGAVYTSGTLQALLSTSVIPITLLLSVFMLKKKVPIQEYLGAAVIILGVAAVIVVPQIINHFHPDPAPIQAQDSTPDAGTVPSPSAGPGSTNKPLFNIIFLISIVPGALSAVYKESTFTSEDVDVNFLQAWVALWQLVFGFLLLPCNTLKFLGDNYMPWSQLPHSLSDGFMCLVGVNTIVTNCGGEGQKPCDQCDGAWIMVFIYLAFNCLYNVVIILVIKHGSAAMLFIISTLQLPLLQMMFSVRAVNDPPDKLSWSSILGLCFIVLGLLVYHRPFQSAPPGQEDVLVPFAGRLSLLPGHVRRPIMAHMQRTGATIRGSYYTRIGLISSPATPNTRRNSPLTSPISQKHRHKSTP